MAPSQISLENQQSRTRGLIYNICDLDEYHVAGRTNIRYVLDIGANIGIFAKHINHLYPNAFIVGYEPDEANYTQLLESPPLSCAVLNLGLSDKFGMTTFASRFDEAHICTEPNHSLRGVPCIKETIYTIPATLAFWAFDRIDICKCDVEGSEYEIFMSIDDAILQRVRYLTLEVHPWIGNEKIMELYNKLDRTFAIKQRIVQGGALIWTGECR